MRLIDIICTHSPKLIFATMEYMLGNTRRPDITFHSNGRIDVSSRVAKILGLADGDVIDIAYDNVEYYLYVKYKGNTLVGRHEGMIHPTNRNKHYCNNMRAYSKRLCGLILAMHRGVSEVRLPVGEVETRLGLGKVLPIIVRCVLGK